MLGNNLLSNLKKNWILIFLGTVQNQNFYKRTFYIFICQEALDIFSTSYFKKHFFLPLLTLAGIDLFYYLYVFVYVFDKLYNRE